MAQTYTKSLCQRRAIPAICFWRVFFPDPDSTFYCPVRAVLLFALVVCCLLTFSHSMNSSPHRSCSTSVIERRTCVRSGRRSRPRRERRCSSCRTNSRRRASSTRPPQVRAGAGALPEQGPGQGRGQNCRPHALRLCTSQRVIDFTVCVAAVRKAASETNRGSAGRAMRCVAELGPEMCGR